MCIRDRSNENDLLQIKTGTNTDVYLNSDDSSDATNTMSSSYQEWMHITYVFDETSIKAYKNGSLVSNATNNESITTSTRAFHYVGEDVSGTIAYIRFWDSGLASSDIQIIYENREIQNPSIFGTVPATITDSYDSSVVATPYNGVSFTTAGAEFDGVDDYLDLTPWEFGGPTMVETYVKYNSLDNTTIINMENNISATSPIYSNSNIILYNANNTQEAVTYPTGAFSALTGDTTQNFRFYINKWGSPLYFGNLDSWRGSYSDFEKDGALRLYSGASILWGVNAVAAGGVVDQILLVPYRGHTARSTYNAYRWEVPFRIHLVNGNDGDLISAGDTVYFLHQNG